MIKFDHFSRFQKDFRQKMQGLHKIDHNSRKKLKTQGWKTQNSSKKLKVSANSFGRVAENRSKLEACFKLMPNFVGLFYQNHLPLVIKTHGVSFERQYPYLSFGTNSFKILPLMRPQWLLEKVAPFYPPSKC